MTTDPAVGVELRARVEADEDRHRRAAQELTARHEGALEAAEDARRAVPRFIGENRKRLTVELTGQAVDAHDGMLAQRQALYAALGEWSRVASMWRRCLEQWGESPALVPPNLAGSALTELDAVFAPFESGVPRDPRRFYPCPPEQAPGTGPDVNTGSDAAVPVMRRA